MHIINWQNNSNTFAGNRRRKWKQNNKNKTTFFILFCLSYSNNGSTGLAWGKKGEWEAKLMNLLLSFLELSFFLFVKFVTVKVSTIYALKLKYSDKFPVSDFKDLLNYLANTCNCYLQRNEQKERS